MPPMRFIIFIRPPPSTWFDEFNSGPTPLAPGENRGGDKRGA